jgi:hypothetical protein
MAKYAWSMRIDRKTQQRWEFAAAVEGLSLTEFVRSAADDRARRAVDTHNRKAITQLGRVPSRPRGPGPLDAKLPDIPPRAAPRAPLPPRGSFGAGKATPA